MIETLGTLTQRNGHDILNGPPVFERRDFGNAKIGSAIYNLLSTGASTYTGRPVSPATAMTMATVYGCVSKIAKAVASCPLITFINTGKNSDTKTPAINDYRYRMLKEEPNSEMSSFQWREQMVASLLLWGNSYNYLEWDGAGRLRNIWPLEPGYVQVLRTAIGGELVYRYFPHNPYSVPVRPGIYPWQDILHIPYLGFDGLMGFSPITLMRQAVGLGLGQEEYFGRFLKHGGKPPYWIEIPGMIDDRDKFMATWRENTGALDEAGKVALMYGGMKLHEMKMSPEDAQFIEGRNFQVLELCRVFDMPAFMMAAPGTATYASAEQGDIYFAKHTIAPAMERIEQKCNITVLGNNDAITCRHDLSALLRGDVLSMSRRNQTLIACGEISPNEARSIDGFNPDPDPEMDGKYMNGAMATVKYIFENGMGGKVMPPQGEDEGEDGKTPPNAAPTNNGKKPTPKTVDAPVSDDPVVVAQNGSHPVKVKKTPPYDTGHGKGPMSTN
jgi:HK97 family phage portal protein